MTEDVMKFARLAVALALISVLSLGCATVGGAQGTERSRAPEFKVTLVTGKEVTLEQFRGKPLVLNFGTSWCPHCLHEMPAMKDASEEYEGRVAFLMVFVKSPKKDVEALVKKYRLNFMVADDEDAVVGKAYGVKGIPVTFFIDKDGYIVDEYFGSIEKDELTGKLDSLLGVVKK